MLFEHPPRPAPYCALLHSPFRAAQGIFLHSLTERGRLICQSGSDSCMAVVSHTNPRFITLDAERSPRRCETRQSTSVFVLFHLLPLLVITNYKPNTTLDRLIFTVKFSHRCTPLICPTFTLLNPHSPRSYSPHRASAWMSKSPTYPSPSRRVHSQSWPGSLGVFRWDKAATTTENPGWRTCPRVAK